MMRAGVGVSFRGMPARVAGQSPVKSSRRMPASAEPTYEARLEAVLESVTDAFYAVDTDWRYVVFNRAAEAYFGVERDKILGQKLWDIFPQGVGTPFETYCRAAMDEAKPTTFET